VPYKPLLDSASFPDAFVQHGATTQSLDFSRAGKLEVECHPMMGQATLVVRSGSEVLMERQYPRSVAQVIVKALLLGRRNFNYPVESTVAETTLQGFLKWFSKVQDKIAIGCGMSAVGTSYEDQVYFEVLSTLHIDPNILAPEFFGRLALWN
jgi:hypothetical protein